MGKTKHKNIGDRGQALVEMALVLPVFLLLLWGVIEFGRFGHAYLTVTHAAREGARFGAVGYDDQEIMDEIDDCTVSLESDKITVRINPPQDERYAGDSIEVEVEYSLVLMLPVVSSALPNPYPVTFTAVMRVE
ncbi:MAG: TadE family protein [Dethiobacteria bacterium]